MYSNPSRKMVVITTIIYKPASLSMPFFQKKPQTRQFPGKLYCCRPSTSDQTNKPSLPSFPAHLFKTANASAVHDYPNETEHIPKCRIAVPSSLHFVSRHKLILLLSARAAPERPSRTDRRALPAGDVGGRRVRSNYVAVVRPPAEEEDGAAEDEADESDEDPVASHLRGRGSVCEVCGSLGRGVELAYPENKLDVCSVPRVAQVVREEAPRVSVVLFREDDAHAATVSSVAHVSTVGRPMPPQHAQEKRTSAAHDSNVGQKPAAIVVLYLVGHEHEERMFGNSTHSVIGDTGGQSLAHPGRVGEQRFELTVASVVEVEINAAVVSEDEIANGVGALDRVRVVPESILKPFVFLVDEFQAHLVGPQLIFPVWM